MLICYAITECRVCECYKCISLSLSLSHRKSYKSRSFCQRMVLHKSIYSHHCPLLDRCHCSHRDWVHNLQPERKKKGFNQGTSTNTHKQTSASTQTQSRNVLKSLKITARENTSITKQPLETIRIYCNPFGLVKKSHRYSH